MQREEKSERSRRAILDSALYLFSHHGYGATKVRDIAERAGVSTGNVYHHFPDKDTLFRTLIDEFIELTSGEHYPFTRVLRGPEQFPDNIEQLGYAARDSVRQYRNYVALIYVDVIEFGGTHVRQLHGDVAKRFERHFEERGEASGFKAKFRPGVSPTSAMILTTRLFFDYFSMEILFGVEAPFGKSSSDVVTEIADIIRNGICAR
jgi:AcrR family transcriptional regulator